MTVLVTLNVSREQIETDLRAGRTVEEISQEWSEPRANVYAIKRAMDAVNAAPAQPAATLRPVPAVPANAAAGVLALVNEASQSRHARTRALGAKLDQLVEDLEGRLTAERADAAEAERKRRDREQATAEVARLEAALRDARAKLGGRSTTPTNRSKAGSPGGKSARPVYDGGPTTAVVRAWAATNGVEHPTHGTLPRRVIEAYRDAVGDAGGIEAAP